MQHFGSSAFIKFGNPDFVKLSESMGLKGYRITDSSELLPTLREALAQDLPTIIDCPIDYRENFRLSQTANSLACELD
jgi:acetolactate synthase-1/2/3 large subunit